MFDKKKSLPDSLSSFNDLFYLGVVVHTVKGHKGQKQARFSVSSRSIRPKQRGPGQPKLHKILFLKIPFYIFCA